MASPANEANMERGTIATIMACQMSQMSIPSHVEMFLCPDGDDGAYLYYFVDHRHHRVFWFDGVDLASLGLPPVSSKEHSAYPVLLY